MDETNGPFARAGMQPVRLFTPNEANETLPLVKRIVSDITQTGKLIRDIVDELGDESRSDPEANRLLKEINDLFLELEKLGCSYKDWNFELGLVDFPAVIDGEEVLLCWRSDEPSVMFFHGVFDGFPGRKSIPPGILNEEG